VTIVISGSYSLNNFKEDIQKMYKRAGVKGEGILFLFTDSQVESVAVGSEGVQIHLHRSPHLSTVMCGACIM
jgi:hypothetical protein